MRKNHEPSLKVQLINDLPSKTKQSFKDQLDINKIVAKSRKNGVLPEMIKANPRYGDFSNVPDYLAAQIVVQHANEQFDALSAQTRERFRNDPALFLEFVGDPQNLDEMIKLGLAKRRPLDTSTSADAPPSTPSTLKPDPKA